MKLRLVGAAGLLLACLLISRAADEPAKKVDLEELAGNRADWPAEVTLKEAVSFSIIVGGREAGEVEARAGESVKVIEVLGEEIKVAYGDVQKVIPTNLTDLEERVLALRKERAEAAERQKTIEADKVLEARIRAYQRDREEKLLIDGRLVDKSALKIEKLNGVVRQKNVTLTGAGNTKYRGTIIELYRVETRETPRRRGLLARLWGDDQTAQQKPLTGETVFIIGYVPVEAEGQDVQVEAFEMLPSPVPQRSFKLPEPFSYEQWKEIKGYK